MRKLLLAVLLLAAVSEAQAADKRLGALAIAHHVSVGFDSWTTRRNVSRGELEVNPVWGPVSRNDGLYALMQLEPTALDFLRAKVRNRKVRKLAIIASSYLTTIHAVDGFRNLGHKPTR